ncbi:hypothetical protein G6F64_014572 [Rhizopus arrhizus]|uniref:Uncharacterized protein n=1 Tax=Rhizopus oryzae TaxID=64495 RepID=A0A9P6WT67_RHIOR|nr:hypothetical protein G6F64_014572 [Rhizopus arrhizus]
MQVAHADALLGEVLGEVLRHALGQRGDQHAVAGLDALVGLAHQVIDLGTDRTDFHHRIDQAGRAHHQSHVGSAPPTPRSAADDCPAPMAGGSRIRPGSPCASDRP